MPCTDFEALCTVPAGSGVAWWRGLGQAAVQGVQCVASARCSGVECHVAFFY